MRKIVFLQVVVLIFFVFGCSILPKGKPLAVNYYDFGTIKTGTIFLPEDIRLGRVSSAYPSEKRMIFRDGGNRLLFDECNRWATAPERLVRDRISLAIPVIDPKSPQKTNVKRLDAEILSMEGDIKAKTANFAIRFDLRDDKDEIIMSKTFFESVPMQDMSATAFADAIAATVDSTLRKLAEECKK